MVGEILRPAYATDRVECVETFGQCLLDLVRIDERIEERCHGHSRRHRVYPDPAAVERDLADGRIDFSTQQRSISTVPRVSQLGDERTAIGRPSVLPAAPIQVASARVSFSCSGRTAYRSWSVGAVAKAIWPKKRA